MISNAGFVNEADIDKVMRLRRFGFVLRVMPVKGGFYVEIQTDPRLS